ncbi:hypothetical protein HDU99_000871 [Rhizoclosmatium hyalinum]|nr:hypothetical protein HDU99_000871 [Rhizoclosmatium hyalinum]
MDDLFDSGGFFGTPQPASASDVKAKDRNSVLPVFLQEARDERGRKRLHGAFTGGFSAGYFNTVGSKEGWQPQTFVSSRSQRNKFEQNVDQFMDEEDLAEINNAKKVTATQDFDALGSTQRELARKAAVTQAVEKSDGPIASRILQDLIIPSSDPIGVRLLRKMGWRDGQGVGPRAKRKFTEKQDDEDDVHAENVLFAPRDIRDVILTGRVGRFGVGYDRFGDGADVFRPNAFSNADGGGGSSLFQERQRNAFGKSGGFGTGVFEEEDEDVYGGGGAPGNLGSLKNSRMSIVDDDEEDDSEWHRMSSSKKKPVIQQRRSDTNSTANERTGFDGKPPLSGFHVASIQLTAPIWFDAPKPPADYIPKHRLAFERQSAVSTPYPLQPNQQQPNLTAERRREILGEEALAGPTRSVFSYMSARQQDALQALIDSKIAGKDGGKKKDDKQPIPDAVPVDKETAVAALKGFLPFTGDEAKQARYKSFLEGKAGVREGDVKFPPHFTPREVAHELLEFSKSAHMYKPLSGMMASRFTSSGDGGAAKDKDSTESKERVYGRATRSSIEFRPHKLVCKRFNIANPYPEPKQTGPTPPKALTEADLQKEILNKDAMSELIHYVEGGGAPVSGPAGRDGAAVKIHAVVAEEEKAVEEEKVEPVRPAMDIFKAIFADSDSEDDESSEEDEKVVEAKAPLKAVANAPVAVAAPVPTVPVKAAVVASAPSTTSLPPPTFRPLFSRKQDRSKVVEPIQPVSAAPETVPESVPVPSNPDLMLVDSPSKATPAEPAAIPLPNLSSDEDDAPPPVVTKPLQAASWATSLISKKPPASVVPIKRSRDGDESSSASDSSDESGDKDRRRKHRKSSSSSSSKKEKKKKEGKEKKRKKDKSSSSKKKSSRHREEEVVDEWVEATASAVVRSERDAKDSRERETKRDRERDRDGERSKPVGHHNRPRASDFF